MVTASAPIIEDLVFSFIVTLAAIALAIDNATDILTTVDLLEPLRTRFDAAYPRFSKIGRCKFCMSFWLSGLAGLAFPFLGMSFVLGWIITWFSLHRATQALDDVYRLMFEFKNRYINYAPINVRVTQVKDGPASGV